MTFRIPLSSFVDQTARDEAAAAQTTANAAQTTATNALQVASARNHVFVQSTAPTTATASLTLDDLWIDTGNGNRISSWDGSAWSLVPLGTQAFAAASITTDLLAAGAVAAGNLAADAINGRTITGGTYLTAPQGLGAGVHIYQSVADPDTDETHGVIEFADGITGDSPAQIIGRATPNQRGTSASDGGSLALIAGTYNLTPGPHLALNVVPDGAGGYFRQATLDTPLRSTDGEGTVTYSTGWAAYSASSGLRIYKSGDGIVHAWGTVLATAAHAANAQIATLPAAFCPTSTWPGLGDMAQTSTGVVRVSVWPSGAVFVDTAVASGGYVAFAMTWPGPDLPF